MRKFLAYSVSIIVLLVLNIIFPPLLSGAPNFLFLLVVFYALRKNSPDFLLIAFFAGLFLDIYSAAFFGTYTLAFLAIGLAINYSSRTFFTADLSVQFITAIITGAYFILIIIFYTLNLLALRLHFTLYVVQSGYFSAKIWIDLLLNLAFAAPVYYLTLLNDKITARAK
jgi:rod shape-determining protein MreD